MKNPKVIVLLSSFNGEKYLQEQVESVMSQTNVDVELFIRDDGSLDRTQCVIMDLVKNYPTTIKYQFGKNIGVIKSFFELLENATDADYYAFCDQDDVWDDDKLNAAVTSLSKYNMVPSMYFCRTLPVDCNLKPLKDINQTTDSLHVFNIHEVMTRNNVIGCTLVINKELRNRIIGKIPKDVTMHDHWIYSVCLAIGGTVVYDMNRHIMYRQHGQNVVGNKKNLKSKILHSSFAKRNTKIRSSMAKMLIEKYGPEMSAENLAVVSRYAYYDHSFWNKLDLIIKECKFARNLKKRLFFAVEVIAGLF